jgi:hypothetical protein
MLAEKQVFTIAEYKQQSKARLTDKQKFLSIKKNSTLLRKIKN